MKENRQNLVEFNNFYFKYKSQVDYSLCDINLKIKKGEKIVIVGDRKSVV